MYITNPTLPYCCPIETRLAPGSLIRISGTVSTYATTFAINLQCGPNVNPRDDVALHLSPVFTPPPRIVRNSISANRWGPEESFGGFPLAPGSPFEFLILVEPGEFRIALNGMHFTEFRHRLPFERISHIAVDGDAQLSVMAVEGSHDAYASASAPPMDHSAPYGSAPPYPMGGPGMAPGLYPSLGGGGGPAPYPPSGPPGGPYPPVNPYIAPTMPPSGGMPYPSGGYPAPGGAYPGGQPGGYPGGQPGGYPGQPGGYPAPGGYPGGHVPPPPPGYPQAGSSSSKPGVGGMIGTALGGLGAGAAATAIGSKLFGNKHHGHGGGGGPLGALGGLVGHGGHGGGGGGPLGALGGLVGLGGGHGSGHAPHLPGQKPKKSSSIPIGTIAAGAGAAALGAAVLSGHHPFKGAKKLFKHKHKFGKFKHKGWGHKGWGSSSSSSSEEEE